MRKMQAMFQPHTVILQFKISKNAFAFFAIDQFYKLTPNCPSHVIQITHDVMEFPAAEYKCWASSIMVFFLFFFF